MQLHREGKDFVLRFDVHDAVSGASQMSHITIEWRDANDLQTRLSQLLMDFEIERGAYPISDEDDYMMQRYVTREPF